MHFHLQLSQLTLLLLFFYLHVRAVTAFVVSPSLLHRNNNAIRTRRNALSSLLWATSSTSTPVDSTSSQPQPHQQRQKHIVIVGGGWAGFTAADTLAFSSSSSSADSFSLNIHVTLLDASPRGKGGLAGGWRTKKTNRPVEAGIHGFWREYKNTFAILEKRVLLNNSHSTSLDDILTPYTPSALYSRNGRVALAPVINNHDDNPQLTLPLQTPLDITSMLQSLLSPKRNDDSDGLSGTMELLKPLAALLPPPLDLALMAEYDPSNPLSIRDRISALGLLGQWADFGQEDLESWNRYDKFSAEDLFLVKGGITKELYDEMVTPLLHVLPMAPGWDTSAAAALSCFHVFALQSSGAFDVRWCRGSIAERIFNPWAELLTKKGVSIRGSSKVASIQESNDGRLQISLEGDDTEDMFCDAVVMAVGGVSMAKLVPSCHVFDDIPIARAFNKLRGVTCVAVRFFLKPHTITSGLKGGQYDSTNLPPDMANAMKDTPVIVCGPEIEPELKETGFCIYDLARMHDEFAVRNNKHNDTEETTAVLEVDFFRAPFADTKDDNEIAELALRAVATTLKTTPIDSNDIVDLAVVRARDAVSHFAVQSASYSPPVRLSPGKGIYMCGDWIDRSGHASWSTEKAVVTGRQAGQAILKDLNIKTFRNNNDIKIIPAATDTPQLEALRKVAKILRSIAPPPDDGVPLSPWAFLQRLR